jgi:predicted MFS family arabinose efflux permease
VLGNSAAAVVADRAPLRATLFAATALALSAVGLSLTDQNESRLPMFIIWGIAHTANVVLCQVRVTLAGRSAPAFAMALNISAANLGIALGALAGGWVVTRWGIDAIGWGSLGLLPVIVGLVATLAAQSLSSSPAIFSR